MLVRVTTGYVPIELLREHDQALGFIDWKTNSFILLKNVIPRDNEGGFIDNRGRSWKWDPKKKEWDVQIDGGETHINVNPDGKITH